MYLKKLHQHRMYFKKIYAKIECTFEFFYVNIECTLKKIYANIECTFEIFLRQHRMYF